MSNHQLRQLYMLTYVVFSRMQSAPYNNSSCTPIRLNTHVCDPQITQNNSCTHTTHIILQKGRFTHCVHTNQSIIIHWLCANELATMCNCLRQCVIALCEYSVPNANVNTTQNLQSSYMHTIHTYMCHIACVRCLCANVNQSLYNDVASCDKE